MEKNHDADSDEKFKQLLIHFRSVHRQIVKQAKTSKSTAKKMMIWKEVGGRTGA